jgi:hypothetical protein
MRLPVGPRYWYYYEWADGLGNTRPPADPNRLDAPLNLFLLLALDEAAFLAYTVGDESFAAWCSARRAEAAEAVRAAFWDAGAGAFRTYIGNGQAVHFAELTQSLALLAGILPDAEARALRAKLAAAGSGWVPCTLSHSIFKFDALMGEPDRYGTLVKDVIARDWGHMLRAGATSFWETIEGAAAFDDAGSLCHGWSAVPLYFYYAWVLGVKPARGELARYEADPHACGLTSARGLVPLPGGKTLEVEWTSEETADGTTMKRSVRET